MVDGTHIDASVPVNEVARLRGRNGPTQNVLDVANPDKRFTYVKAELEGFANDFIVLKTMVFAGYMTMLGFIAPCQSV